MEGTGSGGVRFLLSVSHCRFYAVLSCTSEKAYISGKRLVLNIKLFLEPIKRSSNIPVHLTQD